MTYAEIITKLCEFAAGLSDLQERSRHMAEDMQSFLKDLQAKGN